MSERKLLELTKWLRIPGYTEKYNLTAHVLSQWIQTTIIKEDVFHPCPKPLAGIAVDIKAFYM